MCRSGGATYYRARSLPGYIQGSVRFDAHIQQTSCAILAKKYGSLFGLLGLVTKHLVGDSDGLGRGKWGPVESKWIDGRGE